MNFDVDLSIAAAGKFAAEVAVGKLTVRDRFTRMESVYQLAGLGQSFGVGVTINATDSFSDVWLDAPCHDWTNAIFTLESRGFVIGLGIDRADLTITCPNGVRVKMTDKGWTAELSGKLEFPGGKLRGLVWKRTGGPRKY